MGKKVNERPQQPGGRAALLKAAAEADQGKPRHPSSCRQHPPPQELHWPRQAHARHSMDSPHAAVPALHRFDQVDKVNQIVQISAWLKRKNQLSVLSAHRGDVGEFGPVTSSPRGNY